MILKFGGRRAAAFNFHFPEVLGLPKSGSRSPSSPTGNVENEVHTMGVREGP